MIGTLFVNRAIVIVLHTATTMSSFGRASLASHLLLSVPAMAINVPSASANLFRGGEEVVRSTPHSPIPKQVRVIGGDKAEPNRYPWAVSLQDGGGHFCGGSLIGKDTVLTAAHCVDGEGNNFSIVVGSDTVNGGEKIGVRVAIEHPDYNSGTEEYDFAVVFLEESVSNIPLVRLNDDNSYPAPGSTTFTMGWGDTDPGDGQKLSKDLLITDVEVISNDECADVERDGESYGNWIYDDMICADTKGQDACQGDSGGPLITRGANAQSDVQVGVVSWGIGCAFMPGVYARVSMGYNWIRETVCDESNDPPGSLCGTEEPTNQPTKKPTPNPTNQPTRFPTKLPTNFPTNQPTRFPTNFPTRFPTNKPTNKPTASPSQSPTSAPTTAEPTASPTTAEPTMSPTEAPTSVPSLSNAPSDSPSASPSVSSQPTSHPTDSPSISLSPSGAPSVTPTISSVPSESPTSSLIPTIAPSVMPTNSQQPTSSSAPTALPSLQPSVQPSDTPSVEPSSHPSMSPSMSPSTSSSPSSFPSKAPSLRPSNVPSISTSPSMSSRPTESSPPSSMPSEEKTDRVNLGNSLLIADALALAEGDGNVDNETKNASFRTCNSLFVGGLLSSFVSLWAFL